MSEASFGEAPFGDGQDVLADARDDGEFLGPVDSHFGVLRLLTSGKSQEIDCQCTLEMKKSFGPSVTCVSASQ